MREYYQAQIGHTFGSDVEAEQDYLENGWRLGILPNPFVEPAARHSLADAEQLRSAVAGLLAGKAPDARWIRPSDRIDLSTLVQDEPEILRHLAGPGGHVLANPKAKALRAVSVQLGPSRSEPAPSRTRGSTEPPTLAPRSAVVSWPEYRAKLDEQTDLVRATLDAGMFDLEYYQQQTGTTFLSTEAALADYVESGEAAGWAPHPRFEPEWFAAMTDSELDDPDHVESTLTCRLLEFVARGQWELGSPHAEPQLDADSAVADAVRRQAQSFAADNVACSRGPAPLERHVVVEASSDIATSTPVLVLVDGRSLRYASVLEPFATLVAQDHQAWTCHIVMPDEINPSVVEIAESMVTLDDRIELVTYDSETPIGSVMEQLRTASPAEVVAFWDPSQYWKPVFLATAVAALDRHPEASITVSPTQGRHAWLTKDDPLWLSSAPMAPGLVLRSGLSDGGELISTDLDGAVEWDIVTRLAGTHTVAILPPRLLRIDGKKPVETRRSRRRWANEIRARRLLQLDPERPVVQGRVSMLMPTFQDWWMTERAVRAVLDHSGDHDVEVVVLDNGSRRSVSAILTAAFAGEDRVVIQRAPLNCDFALGTNLALATSTGEFVVFLNNDTTVTPGWLTPLVEAVEAGASAAQPLLLYPDGTIQTAGTVFLGAVTPPTHLLAAFPAEDADASIAAHPFSAVTAACMLMRASDAAELGGFDSRYVNGMEDVDLCLRLGDLTGRPLRVVPAARVVHHESQSPGRFQRSLYNRKLFVDRWNARLPQLDDRAVLAGAPVEISGLTSHPAAQPHHVRTAELRYSRRARTVQDGPAAGLPCLRWAIKIAAPNTLAGDAWGDTFFAADLAAALRGLGQEVVVDRGDTFIRPKSDHLDDVNLALRGLRRFQPQPGATNLLWVISHPDKVLPDELRSGWDRVYSAGPSWASTMTQAHGVEVLPLLQATNAHRFTPDGDRLQSDTLFVGRTRKIFRPVVRDAIAAGADLSVYGDDGWEDLIDARFIKGSLMSNELLPAAYRGARIVLNDHWDDMAAHGFLSNRLFDAAAAGALVATDTAVGIGEVFGPTVRTFADAASLKRLLDPDESGWPDRETRLAEAHRIRKEHSFDVRARTLLADVLLARGIDPAALLQ